MHAERSPGRSAGNARWFKAVCSLIVDRRLTTTLETSGPLLPTRRLLLTANVNVGCSTGQVVSVEPMAGVYRSADA